MRFQQWRMRTIGTLIHFSFLGASLMRWVESLKEKKVSRNSAFVLELAFVAISFTVSAQERTIGRLEVPSAVLKAVEARYWTLSVL